MLGVESSSLHDRLREVVGDRTYRALADLTGQHPETVRRYMQGQAPSVEFLAAVCSALGVSADWLLTGRGPSHGARARDHGPANASPGDLLVAMANTLESMAGRIDRLEVFAQTLETRVRSGRSGRPAATPEGASDGAEVIAGFEKPDPSPARRRARAIADAVAKRPPADAR